jgi:hypothetical protein
MQVMEHGCRRARRVIVVMAAIALLHEAAAAADNAPNKDAAPTPTAQSLPDTPAHRSGRLAFVGCNSPSRTTATALEIPAAA